MRDGEIEEEGLREGRAGKGGGLKIEESLPLLNLKKLFIIL